MKIKILMLEDLDEDVGMVKRMLKKEGIDFDLKQVYEKDSYEEALLTYNPDVILCDHALPQFNSIEALTIRNQKSAETPFILVTGTVSEEFAAQCIKNGADDYVLKTNLTRLPVAISNALETKELEHKRKEDEESIRIRNNELVKINKELDSFIYSVSHNLRAPLSSVLGLVNLAKIEIPEKENPSLRYLGLIEESVNKLDMTIKDILDYSRNSRVEIIPSEIDLEQIIGLSYKKIQFYEGFNSIEKKTEITSKVPFYADKYRITTLLSNLLSNAVKFADSTKSKSFIRITATLDYPYSIITIADNGIGISAEYTSMIYNMFYRATEKSDGAGLGLYVVKEIVERLHGTIQLTTNEGEGTTFTLKIPNLNPEYHR
jgi:signal transduction histidine kinase